MIALFFYPPSSLHSIKGRGWLMPGISQDLIAISSVARWCYSRMYCSGLLSLPGTSGGAVRHVETRRRESGPIRGFLSHLEEPNLKLPREQKSITAMSTHYDVLGLPGDASTERIKRAYRSLVKVCHPDKFPSGSEAETAAGKRIRDINAAYAVLSNSQRRTRYDANLRRQATRNGTPEPEHCCRCKKLTGYWETASRKRVTVCYACHAGG